MAENTNPPPISEEAGRAAGDNLANSTKVVQKSSEKLAQDQMRQAEASNQLKIGLSQLGSGTIQFTRAIMDGSTGMSKYGRGVENVTEGIGGVLASIGPFGAILGIAVKAFGKIVGTTLEQNDMIIDGYDKLSNFGGSISLTTDSLRELGRTAGYSVQSKTFPKFVDIVASMGQNLTSLGTTAGDGMLRFGEIAKVSDSERDKFNKLGVTQEKLTKLQASYIGDQSKIGLLRNRTNNELRDASLKYATNLLALSALTGENVETLAKERQEQMNDVAFNLEIRKQSQTEEGRKKAEAFRDLVSRVQSGFGKSFQSGIQNIYANNATISEEAIALSRLTGGAITDWVKNFKANPTPEKEVELLKNIQQAIKDQLTANGTALKSNIEIANMFGISVETLESLTKEFGLSTEAERKAAAEAKLRQDPIKDAQNEANKLTRDLGSAFDRLAQMISGPVNNGFRAMLAGFKWLTKGFLKMANKLGIVEDDTLPYLFDSFEDLAKEYKETQDSILIAREQFNKRRGETVNMYDQMGNVIGQEDPESSQQAKLLRELEKRQGVIAEVMKRQAGDDFQSKLDQVNQQKKPEEPKRPEDEQKKVEPAKQSENKVPEPPKPESTASTKEGTMGAYKTRARTVQPETEDKKPVEPKKPESNQEATTKEQPKKQPETKLPEKKKEQPNPNMDANKKLTQTVIVVPQDKAKITLDKPNIQAPDGKEPDVSKQQTPPGHRYGGIAKGPVSGYGDILHGMEASVPLPDGKSIPVTLKLPTDLTTNRNSLLSDDDALEKILSEYTNTLTQPIYEEEAVAETNTSDDTSAMIVMITDKMETLLDRLKENNDIQYEMLTHSKV